MRESLVFFGAGASFGSEPTARTPPLGGALFAELAAFAPGTWGALQPPWPANFAADFEPAMASFIASGGFGGPLQWDMADYFLSQFSATPESAYVALLQALKHDISRYSFASLNYETMLFQARALAGLQASDLPVCLPHGSAQLCCVGISASAGVSYSGGLSTGGTVRVFADMRDFHREKAANVFPPVMSYFEPAKFTVSCANFIEEQRERFAARVSSADVIAIVGVRVHPSDKHIWEPLAATPARITYVAGPSAATEFERWASREGRSKDNAVPQYFMDGLEDLVACLS
jgi:hypothetical protein